MPGCGRTCEIRFVLAYARFHLHIHINLFQGYHIYRMHHQKSVWCPRMCGQILNSLVPCRIFLFCQWFGTLWSLEITNHFHSIRIGYLDLSRNEWDMPCPCTALKSMCPASVSFDARLWHGNHTQHLVSCFVEDGSVHAQSVCSGRTCEIDLCLTMHFSIFISTSIYCKVTWSTVCIIKRARDAKECVSNSKFTSSMSDLLVLPVVWNPLIFGNNKSLSQHQNWVFRFE